MKLASRTLAGIAVVALLASSAAAYYGPGRGMGARDGNRTYDRGYAGPRGGDYTARRMMALELTTEQAQRMETIRANTAKQIAPKQAQIQVKRIEMSELMRQANPNARQVDAKIKEIGDLRNEIQTLRVRGRLEVRSVLTPEQLEKYLDPAWCPDPTRDTRRDSQMRRTPAYPRGARPGGM
jgi:Spy/CpxP family protein refolding chaperone